MRSSPFLFSAILLTAVVTRGADFARNIVEVVAQTDGGSNLKANGLLFKEGDAIYLLTVGHEFASATDRTLIKLITYGGDHVRGRLVYNYYNEDDREKTDIAVLKVASETPVPLTYHWQRGKLIDEVAVSDAPVRIYNGREVIEGYRVAGQSTATTILLKPIPGAKILQGFSGGVVTMGDVAVGLVRATDPKTGSIEVIRMDVASALVERSLASLETGDVELLISWAHRGILCGDYARSTDCLARARVFIANATIDRQALQSQLTLTQASHDIANGKLYETQQVLQQLKVAVDGRNEWLYGAQCRILLGQIGRISGYKFSGESADKMLNPTAFVKEGLLGPIKEAQDHFNEAAAILRQHNMPALLGVALLGQAAGLGYEAQQRSYREVIDLCRDVSPQEAVIACAQLNLICAKLGFPGECDLNSLLGSLSDHEKAIICLETQNRVGEAIALLQTCGTPFEIAYAQEIAGDCSNNPDIAVPYYELALEYYKTNQSGGLLALLRVQAKAQRFYPRQLKNGAYR